MKKIAYYGILFPAIVFSLLSCKKYLDAKPDQSLSTISSVEDLQGFLDDYRFMNQKCTAAGEMASDNYYLTDSLFDALQTSQERDAYLWGKGVFASIGYNDWENEYNVVYTSNLVLEGLKEVKRTKRNAMAWEYCKGSALFYRAKAFYEIAQVWAPAYDSTTAAKDLGIPLRLTSDFNVPSVRASNRDSYAQIIKDLLEAVPYLPDFEDNVFRPTKPAAYGLLSRVFLTMQKFKQSKLYADSCLAINNKILDFNTLDLGSLSPFGPILYSNPEDILHSTADISFYLNLTHSYARVDSLLYASYNDNDLRKSVFFQVNMDGSVSFKAAYENPWTFYYGIATDEIYLNRAECLARLGYASNAMKDLNKLLANRWKRGTFIPYSTGNAPEALRIILKERRKELYYRMLRFTDIKRLNRLGANITLKRIIHGQTYILPPSDPRYARPIPDLAIRLSGMKQNE